MTTARTPTDTGRLAEVVNSVTHGIGWVLAVAAMVLMVLFSAMHGTARHVVGTALFGSTLVLLYAMSTLYHAFKNPRVKNVFKVLDHSAIYLLIAGTYTPFCLSSLQGPWGTSLLCVVWGLAALGIIFKSVLGTDREFLSTAIYLAMGWLIVIAIGPLWRALPPWGLIWLFGGGLCYSAGIAFFAWERLPFHHAVWHLFVLAGSACHVVAVMGFVIPWK